jgi:hypothetical protein
VVESFLVGVERIHRLPVHAVLEVDRVDGLSGARGGVEEHAADAVSLQHREGRVVLVHVGVIAEQPAEFAIGRETMFDPPTRNFARLHP